MIKRNSKLGTFNASEYEYVPFNTKAWSNKSFIKWEWYKVINLFVKSKQITASWKSNWHCGVVSTRTNWKQWPTTIDRGIPSTLTLLKVGYSRYVEGNLLFHFIDFIFYKSDCHQNAYELADS